jgi:hypothetical protein
LRDLLFREPFASPFCRRVWFVVAAAIRFATFGERPRALSLRLMCSYCRLRFALFTPRGGIGYLLSFWYVSPQYPDHPTAKRPTTFTLVA